MKINEKKKVIVAVALIVIILTLIMIVYFKKISKPEVIEINQEFEYTEMDSDIEACYISVVYLDGFAYSPSEWLSKGSYLNNQKFTKGEKIGEITLDLKGKNYTGIPPNLSSTHNKRSKIYEVMGVKRERAIILVENNYETIMYRERKIVASEFDPILLTLNEVFNMLSDNPKVIGIELRSEENGSWVNDIFDEKIINIINKEFADFELKNHGELNNEPYSSNRIPINLIFNDGAALHMQVYPDTKYATVFGGYITLSEEFISSLQNAIEEGKPYSTVVDILPFGENEINYMKIIDYVSDKNIICSEPRWSSQALFSILSFYRVISVPEDDSKLLVSFELGISETDYTKIELYDNMTLKLNDRRYEILRGNFGYEDVERFIESYTN